MINAIIIMDQHILLIIMRYSFCKMHVSICSKLFATGCFYIIPYNH